MEYVREKETKSDLIGFIGFCPSVFEKNERLRLHRRKLEKNLTGDNPFFNLNLHIRRGIKVKITLQM